MDGFGEFLTKNDLHKKKLYIGNFTIEIINKTHEVSKSFGKIKKFTNFGLISSKKNLFSDSFLF